MSVVTVHLPATNLSLLIHVKTDTASGKSLMCQTFNLSAFETLLYKFIYGEYTYFVSTSQQSTAPATVQPHNASHTMIVLGELFI